MASKILIQNSSRRKSASRNHHSGLNNRPSITKDSFFFHHSNHEISPIISFSKSPIQNPSKHPSSIFTTKEFPISTPRITKKARKPLKKSQKIERNRSTKINFQAKIHKKKENLRYLNSSLEESTKNFNGVSTPPEELLFHHRTPSPFSEIIDEQLDRYINPPFSRLTGLDLPKKSYGGIEDSYQYSTAESRKKNLNKVSLERKFKCPEPPKTPPPFSIYSKIRPGNLKSVHSKKFK